MYMASTVNELGKRGPKQHPHSQHGKQLNLTASPGEKNNTAKISASEENTARDRFPIVNKSTLQKPTTTDAVSATIDKKPRMIVESDE